MFKDKLELNLYLKHLNRNNYSPATIQTYQTILEKIVPIYLDLEAIENCVAGFYDSPNTAWLWFRTIHAYMIWAKDDRSKEFEKLELPKINQTYREIISKTELMNKTEISPSDDPRLIQKKMIVRFLFETGLKVSELYTIISIDKFKLTINDRSKENKTRMIFHNIETTKKIDFTNLPGEKSIRDWTKLILGEEYTPNVLRSSFANYMISNGANPVMVQLQLGHDRLREILKYLNVKNKDDQATYLKLITS